MVCVHYLLSLLLKQSFEAMPSSFRVFQNDSQVSQSLMLDNLENLSIPVVLIPYDLKVIDFFAY